MYGDMLFQSISRNSVVATFLTMLRSGLVLTSAVIILHACLVLLVLARLNLLVQITTAIISLPFILYCLEHFQKMKWWIWKSDEFIAFLISNNIFLSLAWNNIIAICFLAHPCFLSKSITHTAFASFRLLVCRLLVPFFSTSMESK